MIRHERKLGVCFEHVIGKYTDNFVTSAFKKGDAFA